jgi:nucleolar pre-ribosomal-associated protein 1
MSKRNADEVLDGNQAYLKRQRISNPTKPSSIGPEEEILSGRQLRQLLTFNQDATKSRHGKTHVTIL